ncbi:hypothetical protein PsorP6_000717 [Peronosclerospora sorghi]|uniref:Uncharacterized protein n=1 Tax=Peronosclerospora sorghi TaxID=230839 RepID=A0ACC0WP27_9STRA|nr:hypothetical protein PsorP6_000717 [Peronosclerospora sorghi]
MESSRPYTAEKLHMVCKIKTCKSHYEVLEVAKNATENEVMKAYREIEKRDGRAGAEGHVLTRSHESSLDQSQARASPRRIKRMIDLRLRDDDKGTSAKRSKSTIHDKGEESLVLERADKSPSFSDRKPDTKIEETHVDAADKTLVVSETLDRKTRSGAHKIKLTRKKNVNKTKVGAKELIDKLVSPHFSQRSIPWRETPDSSKKRNKTVRSYAELAHESSPLQLLLKWELVESRGNPTLGRWGHSFTKIAGDQVVVYDGTDDDEQTLGDLHVFDTTRIAGQLHQIVKRSPAHGMNLFTCL